MKHKRIGVFFDKPNEDDYPFHIEFYKTVYRELAEVVHKKGGQLCIVRSMDAYLGKNTFKHGWAFDGGKFVRAEGPFHVDLIWNKQHFSDPEAHVINDPKLDELCVDKWKTYQMFPDVHPRTFLVQSKEEMQKEMKNIRSAYATAKPLDLEGGEGVIIGPKQEVLEKVLNFPYLLQEFVDTSEGIPGIVDEKHDLRLLIINGDIAICSIRTTPPGEFTANVSRGGKELDVDPKKIPPEVLAIGRQVDDALKKKFPQRLYTVDTGRDKDGTWKVFELNSKPGISPIETGPTYPALYDRLSDFLLEA